MIAAAQTWLGWLRTWGGGGTVGLPICAPTKSAAELQLTHPRDLLLPGGHDGSITSASTAPGSPSSPPQPSASTSSTSPPQFPWAPASRAAPD